VLHGSAAALLSITTQTLRVGGAAMGLIGFTGCDLTRSWPFAWRLALIYKNMIFNNK
jgi:hypothetical protein